MKYFSLILLCCIGLRSYAAELTYSNRVEGTAVSTASFSVFDGEYMTMVTNPSWSALFTNRKIRNKVTLGLNPEIVQSTAFSGSVTVDIKTWKWVGSSFTTSTVSQTLAISYSLSNTAVINELSTYTDADAHRIEVKVTGTTGLTLSNVYLEASIEIDRVYAFDNSTPIAGVGAVQTTDFIDFNWDVTKGAEFYELEWMYINDYTTTSGAYLSKTVLPYDFYVSGTRLIIRESHYRIPKNFDHGYVIYRVRGIGLQGNALNIRKEGVWSIFNNKGMLSDAAVTAYTQTITSAKDVNMNWRHEVAYSENGKRFEGMSFLDGMGRGRQFTGGNPVTGQIIVANMYYDAHGRAVITDLPTPTDGEVLHHFPDFNRVDGTAVSYNAAHFDVSDPECSAPIAGFHNNYGAGAYYSNQNSDQDGTNKLIPDGEHFPFSRIKFTPDQSNRIASSGNNGADLQVGGAHDTEYSYSTPDQEELNRLFGSEAGYASHYQKRIITDPNGQVYLEYSDMTGRLVASGLAGSTPANLLSIDGGHSPSMTVSTLTDGSASQSVTPVSMSITIPRTITSTDDYLFDYSLDPGQYTSECLAPEVCFDCIYKLKICITEEKCGDTLYIDSMSINGGTYDEICNGTYPFDLETSVHLSKGNYFVQKTLEIDQAAIDGYWCLYLQENTCVTPFSSLFTTLYNSADFSNCDEEPLVLPSDDPCSAPYQMMLLDVSPGGQYGVFATTSPISVYNTSNSLGTDADWEHPASGGYLDSDGNPAVVEISFISAGVYAPAIKPGSPVSGPLPNGKYTVAPEDLLNVADFITNFDESWADALLMHHPEFCHLEFCWANASSHAFDNTLLSITEHLTACSGGYYNPLGTGIVSPRGVDMLDPCTGAVLDPFFMPDSLGTDYHDDMRDTMEAFILFAPTTWLSMWDYAVLMANCPDADTPGEAITCLRGFKDNPCTNDQVWLNFVQLYLSTKSYYFYQAAAAQMDCNPNIDCIGNPAAAGTPCTYFMNAVSRWNTQSLVENNIDTSDPQGTLEDLAGDMCESMCETYADEWMVELSNCPVVNTALLKADLIAVCAYGCSEQHPQGATSLPTGSSLLLPSGYTAPAGASFNDILALHISGFDESELCSELLISMPGKYEEDMMADTYLDTCGCDLLMTAEAEFDLLAGTGGLPVGVTTVEELLAYNTGLSVPDIDHWLCTCDKAFGPGWTPESSWSPSQASALFSLRIVVPADLTCESCVTCETVADATAVLRERFIDVDDFEETDNYSTILTNYLNETFGFTLSAEAYLTFINRCSGTEGAPVCEITDEMQSFIDVMNLIVHRGELLNNSADKVPLLTDNVVYPGSALQAVFHGTHYWSALSGNMLGLNFGTLFHGSDCRLRLYLPDGATFGFEDIISFEGAGSTQTECGPNGGFIIPVKYLDCGEIKTAILTGATDCFTAQQCYCDANLTLCNQSVQDDMAGNLPCYEPTLSQIYQQAEENYAAQILQTQEQFTAEYNTQCALAFDTELFTQSGPEEVYQFTLFYYDQSGNLVKTVAPKGVTFLTNHTAINASRNNTTGIDDQDPAVVPAQTYETKHSYNSYDAIVRTTNPDQEGATVFWYDYYGRIVASQNPVQLQENKYSYTFYDPQGRSVQTGQVVRLVALTEAIVKTADLGTSFRTWVNAGTRTEVTITTFDRPLWSAPDILARFKSTKQENLRLRVAAIAYFETFSGATDLQNGYTSAIHYSYDLHGNVTESIQDVPALEPVFQDIKSTQYTFDLLSDNVKKVIYQEYARDQQTHTYTYDQLNRLTEVHTSTDGGIHENRDAHYRYYDHGPLSRIEIGQHKVQGNDLAYTINGWLKGMNSSTLNRNRDMGTDGALGYLANHPSVNELFAPDITGFTMGYYQGDYQSIGTSTFEAALGSGNNLTNALSDLWNGNISHTTTAIDVNAAGGYPVQAGVYRYDQLQRLKEMEIFRSATILTANNWSSALETQEYHSDYSYDRNGNLTFLNRNGTTSPGLDMDEFVYMPGTVSGNPSNRLSYVQENGTDYGGYDDIKILPLQASGNYSYDRIGMITSDAQEGILLIEWRRGDHKVKKITRNDANSSELEFVYNPAGQRVLKIERPRPSGSVGAASTWNYTYYVYNASAQLMATYAVKMASGANKADIDELPIYGSSRIGMNQVKRKMYDNGTALPTTGYGLNNIYANTMGEKRYELINHLENVNAVITDRKMVTAGYLAGVNSANAGGTTGWTLASGCGGPTLGSIGGRLVVGSNCATTIYRHENTTPGTTYTYSIDLEVANAGNMTIELRGTNSTGSAGTLLTSWINPASGQLSFTFTAAHSFVRLVFNRTSSGTGLYILGNLHLNSSATYEAVVWMKADYYPFGMMMPGRNSNTGDYRYGYNGMESDNEAKGTGNSHTTEFRQYDSRLGRWMSTDALMQEFPDVSPYVAFNNNPVYFIDPSGLEGEPGGEDWQKGQRCEDENGNRLEYLGNNEWGDAPAPKDFDICKHGTLMVPKADFKRLKQEQGLTFRESRGISSNSFAGQYRAPDFTIRYGNTPSIPPEHPVEQAPFLVRIYGEHHDFYNTRYVTHTSFRLDEPDNFLQLQWRLGGQFQFSTMLMKQKMHPLQNGFKLEATTAFEFGISYNKYLFGNGYFNMSYNLTLSAGPTLGAPKFQDKNTDQSIDLPWFRLKAGETLSYTVCGVGATALGRVDVNFLRNFNAFIGINVHHFTSRSLGTSLGPQTFGSIGSLELLIGGGFSFGR